MSRIKITHTFIYSKTFPGYDFNAKIFSAKNYYKVLQNNYENKWMVQFAQNLNSLFIPPTYLNLQLLNFWNYFAKTISQPISQTKNQ